MVKQQIGWLDFNITANCSKKYPDRSKEIKNVSD